MDYKSLNWSKKPILRIGQSQYHLNAYTEFGDFHLKIEEHQTTLIVPDGRFTFNREKDAKRFAQDYYDKLQDSVPYPLDMKFLF